MKATIQVGDLVIITLPEGHVGVDQKGLWLVVDRPDRPPFQDYYLILKGAHHLVLSQWDLEKVPE
jgi:hypothetical protein